MPTGLPCRLCLLSAKREGGVGFRRAERAPLREGAVDRLALRRPFRWTTFFRARDSVFGAPGRMRGRPCDAMRATRRCQALSLRDTARRPDRRARSASRSVSARGTDTKASCGGDAVFILSARIRETDAPFRGDSGTGARFPRTVAPLFGVAIQTACAAPRLLPARPDFSASGVRLQIVCNDAVRLCKPAKPLFDELRRTVLDR